MTGGQIQTRVLQRLKEDSVHPVYYSGAETLAAINRGQRLFVLLTLCLETTAPLSLSAGVATYRVLQTFADYLLPLRVRVAGGGKVEPARLQDLDGINASWQEEAGTPERYAHLGFDFLAIHPRPDANDTSLDVTYARCPARLTAPSTPEIPEEYHPALADFAIPELRAKEGGAEFSESLKYFERFLDAAVKMADYVRARSKAQLYDRGPYEMDRAKVTKLFTAEARRRGGKQNGR